MNYEKEIMENIYRLRTIIEARPQGHLPDYRDGQLKMLRRIRMNAKGISWENEMKEEDQFLLQKNCSKDFQHTKEILYLFSDYEHEYFLDNYYWKFTFEPNDLLFFSECFGEEETIVGFWGLYHEKKEEWKFVYKTKTESSVTFRDITKILSEEDKHFLINSICEMLQEELTERIQGSYFKDKYSNLDCD